MPATSWRRHSPSLALSTSPCGGLGWTGATFPQPRLRRPKPPTPSRLAETEPDRTATSGRLGRAADTTGGRRLRSPDAWVEHGIGQVHEDVCQTHHQRVVDEGRDRGVVVPAEDAAGELVAE